MVKENATISDNDAISEKLNNFFADMVKNLKIPQYEDHLVNTDDLMLGAKEKFKNYQSIQLIKCHYESKNNKFCSSNITHTEIEKELNKLDSFKSSPNPDIPTKIVQYNIDIFTPILHHQFNKSLELGKFPSEMKLADVTPVFKKEDRTKKENYRPISIMSNLPKVFERCLHNQLSVFFDKIPPKYQCGFWKGFNVRHCLINLLKKWRQSPDNGLVFGALLTDLSKAFAGFSQELLVAKPIAYDVESSSVTLTYDYLTIESKELKFEIITVPGETSYLEYHKDQF